MSETMLRLEIEASGVARLTLARPEVHNAINGDMMDRIVAILGQLEEDQRVRLLVLSGEGPTFSSGIDLKYQRAQRKKEPAVQRQEASRLAKLLLALDRFPKVLVGRINGSAYAGAVGLIACCDVAIAVDSAVFAIPETRLGLLPGMISPYIVRRIGPMATRRLILTARTIEAGEAAALGLINASVPEETLDAAIEGEIDLLLRCAPGATTAAKRLVEFVASHSMEENFDHTIDQVAGMWRSDEAAEGIASFVEKRQPGWVAHKAVR